MNNGVVVEAVGLMKYFPLKMGFFQSLFSKEQLNVHAVDNISFKISKGETFGLVGESGCGKTTAGLLCLDLLEPTSGTIYFGGVNLKSVSPSEMINLRKEMQFIFQNPYESLNPRFSVMDAIAEPLKLLKICKDEDEIEARVKETLIKVNLPTSEDFLDRFPHELSGGQRQRIGVARAFVINPSFIVADEPVSMLDVSVRVGVLKIMKNFVKELGTAFLFITHDLALARYMCDRIAVMYLGRIVEKGPTDQIIKNPSHPYTKALVSAVPVPDPDAQRTEEIPIKGEVPSGVFLPSGCRFHPRCPYAKEKCLETDPVLEDAGKNHFVACLRFREI